jgi:hypothetical protein
VRRPLRSDEGQALIVVAAAFAILLGAVSFGVDWGYALAQRRFMTNAAQAGALAGGRMLATSVVVAGGSPIFNRSQEELYCEVLRYASANRSAGVGGASYRVVVEYGDTSSPTVWTESATSTCPPAASDPVPADTRYIRVSSEVSYPSLLAAIAGHPTMTASGSARSRVAGATVVAGGKEWPMVRHFDPTEFQGNSCGNPCNPDSVPPVTFWSTGNEPNMVYGNFKGQVDLSRYSSRSAPSLVPSLLTGWDQSGSAQAVPATALKTDMSGNCSGGLWDTAGGENPSQANKQCSIPNWFFYPFQGDLSLSTDHTTAVGGQEPPSTLGARPSVCPAPSYVVAPSCDSPGIGDWVETASGNLGSNNSDLMRQRIHNTGKTTPFSDNQVSGASPGTTYGKALVVQVYLWDCAETFTSSASAGQQWSLIAGTGGDCADIPQTGNTPTPDRVHLFAIAPFTFYEGLVSTSVIKGYWGGAFGDPDSCPSGSCELNPLSNTTFLVADGQ